MHARPQMPALRTDIATQLSEGEAPARSQNMWPLSVSGAEPKVPTTQGSLMGRRTRPGSSGREIDRAGTLRIAKVNADAEPELSSWLGVQGIPTLVLFNNGAEVSRQVGALPADQLRDWLDASQPTAPR